MNRLTSPLGFSPMISKPVAPPSEALSLWIADPTPNLYQRLARIHELQPAVILTPGGADETSPISTRTLGLISSAMHCRDVQHIVVCGQPSDLPVEIPLRQTVEMDGESRYQQLVERISARLARQQRVHDRIRAELDQVRAIPAVRQALRSAVVNLVGLFYIPESDSFLVHDPKRDQLIPLE